MENNPVLFKVDSETVNGLARIVDALTKYLQWLIEKKDLEAVNKLSPIVKRMNDLMLGILEGNIPHQKGARMDINQIAFAVSLGAPLVPLPQNSPPAS